MGCDKRRTDSGKMDDKSQSRAPGSKLPAILRLPQKQIRRKLRPSSLISHLNPQKIFERNRRQKQT